MKIIIGIFLLMVPCGVFSQSLDVAMLKELDSIIRGRDNILAEKESRIEKYRQSIKGKDIHQQFDLNTKIYHEYKSFIYDSAFRYALELQALAREMGDPVSVMQSKIDLGFILVSAGLFNETLDTLQSISAAELPDSLKPDFYFLIGRTCYDLSEFNRDDFYSSRYINRGNRYMDSALMYLPENEQRYLMVRGLKNLHLGEWKIAQESYEALIENYRLSDSRLAVVASTLSFIYDNTGQHEKAKVLLITAAMADIRSSKKETVAIMNLAKMLFQEGDIEKSYAYIKIAMQDANFYGANHRKIQVASVFPVIEGKRLSMVESRRNALMVYATGITLLILFMIAFGIVVYKQFRKLQAAKKLISESNQRLIETNHQLVDSTKIKEEYVTYYFNATAGYISRLENLKKTLEMKLMTKRTEDLRFVVNSINIKKEREDLYHNFDKAFLKLFPDFVTVFQSLFREEDRVQLREGQLLNTELRIFALMRMGINDTEKISRILDYSVNTIYTYKARIRRKSIVPGDEFDKRIMGVRII